MRRPEKEEVIRKESGMEKEGHEVGKRENIGMGKARKKMKGLEETSYREPSKRGRKTRKESMENLINAYMVGTPLEVKVIIVEWERELNDNIANQEIEAEEWETMVKDPGNTIGRKTLFHQTI